MIAKETGARMHTPAAWSTEPVQRYIGQPCSFLQDARCTIYCSCPMACRLMFNMDADALKVADLREFFPQGLVPVGTNRVWRGSRESGQPEPLACIFHRHRAAGRAGATSKGITRPAHTGLSTSTVDNTWRLFWTSALKFTLGHPTVSCRRAMRRVRIGHLFAALCVMPARCWRLPAGAVPLPAVLAGKAAAAARLAPPGRRCTVF